MIVCTGLKLKFKIVLLGLIFCLTSGSHLIAQPIFSEDFNQIAQPGFGDRWNTQVWSMAEWRGNVYAGTGRGLLCQQAASIAFFRPDLGDYPPVLEPNLCTPKPEDLPLRAEIWRWRPGQSGWTRIFRSPEDVPVPGSPGKFVARDVGYRSMLVFKEPDGTEALYVATVSPRSFLEPSVNSYLNNPVIPPPRLLRSTDGNTFTPVPQDPGTLLADIKPLNGFRTLTAYKGRLYVVASEGLLGDGNLLESSDPAKGNDSFRKVQVTSKDLKVFEAAVYNGSLYVGSGSGPLKNGEPFAVLKTNTDVSMPYTFREIIPPGGYAPPGLQSLAVISMHVHKNRLFFGTERELIRINPDDLWDVVIGTPRRTPQGLKIPLSGLDIGFDYFFNIHMWRLGSFDEYLYVGTQDQGYRWRFVPPLSLLTKDRLGFDLYATQNGYHYWLISRTGLGDKASNGVRNYQATSFGFFLGSSNVDDGARIWRGSPGNRAIDMPEALEADFVIEASGPKKKLNGNVILSWQGPEDARTYHIYRDGVVGEFKKIGSVDAPTTSFVDPLPPLTAPDVRNLDLSVPQFRELQVLLGVEPSQRVNANKIERQLEDLLELLVRHHYYVVAENANGKLSQPSNVVRAPVRGLQVTFNSLKKNMSEWRAPNTWRKQLQDAQKFLQGSSPKYGNALDELAQLRENVIMQSSKLRARWRSEDLVVLVDKLVRRVELAQLGLLPPKAFL